MNYKLILIAILLLSGQVVSAKNGDNDSSTEAGDERIIEAPKAKTTSWWQRATRWTLGGVAGAVFGAKRYLPGFVNTAIGYAAKPITWTISKFTGWQTWHDLFAEDNSMLADFIAGTVMGGLTGLSDSETSRTEIKHIARILKLARADVNEREKNGKRFGGNQENVKKYEEETTRLFDRLREEGSFSIQVLHSLAKYLLIDWRVADTWMPNLTEDFVNYAAGTGLRELNLKVVQAMPILLTLVMNGKLNADGSTGDLWSSVTKKSAKYMKYGREMLAGTSFVLKVRTRYQREQLQKRRKEALLLRKQRKNDIKMAEVKLPESTGAKPEAPPVLTEKVISAARKALNFWVLTMIAIILAGLFICSYRSGMIKPPTSSFPDQIGEKKVDIYVAKDIRDIEGEMAAADMV